MQTSFTRAHATMLLRYSGISFISGAVNHGFFSGTRSFATAAVGIVLFAAAFRLEHGDDRAATWRKLLWSALLSVGLGFFTGGLQHFPDSPARSAWVVPLGFAVSVAAFVALEFPAWTKQVTRYAALGGVVVVAGSLAALQLLRANPEWLGTHAHGDDHGAATSGVAAAQVVNRSVAVAMGDDMRFSPASLHVAAGETVRISLTNRGQVDHELVIGTPAELKVHAQAMREGEAHAHGGGAAIRLAPGATGELVVTFRDAGPLEFACLIPGHFEAGMRGDIAVAQANAAPVDAAKPAPAAHGSHKH
ncbi:cupredoxin domain-containing protein [Ramlibacter humi]|nr:cupredoxin family protein [Ramlibacter humi]